jgi:peptide/nickel transport system substrate-binding protein
VRITKKWPLAAVVSTALLASACAGATPTSSSGGSASFVIGAGDVDSLDTIHFKSDTAYTVDANLYASVLQQTFQPQDGYLRGTSNYVPALADSFTVSPDGKTATIHLRSGLKFADGSPLTSDDVAYTVQRSLSKAGYTSAFLPYLGIANPQTDITAPDPSTVRIVLTRSSPLLQKFLAFQTFGVLNKKTAEANKGASGWATDYFAKQSTPSGPYQISSWDPAQKIALTKNPNYYDAANTKASSVTIQNMPNVDQRYLALKNGSIDVALNLPPKLVAEAAKDPNLTVYKIPTSKSIYMGMNNTDPALSNKLVRQAISYAVPYDALRQQVMQGYAGAADGPVPSTMVTSLDPSGTKSAYPTDIGKAKALLAQAGVNGLHLTLSVQASDAKATQGATFMQSSLAQAGITVDIAQLTDSDYTTKLSANQLQMFMGAWYSWGEDPIYQMNFLLRSGVPTNYAKYANPQVDQDIMQGVLSTDAAQRQALSQDAQRQIIDDAPWAFLYTEDQLVVTAKNVHGITRPDDGFLRFADLYRQ